MKEVAVIGAGTMGNGIAHVFAMNGYQIKLIDISQESLDKALVTIKKNLDRMESKGQIDLNKVQSTLSNILSRRNFTIVSDRRP